TYNTILAARIFTGIFGGVISSVSFAIITDLFPMQVRGRVMGFVQMAFAVSQVMGLPIGLWLATTFDWHAPFLMIVGLCVPLGIIIALKMQPVNAHLTIQKEQDLHAFSHLGNTISKPAYLRAFAATVLMATGGFMLMPFGSDFTAHNIGIDIKHQPLIYMVTGLVSLVAGPYIGKLSDKFGKFQTFVAGSILALLMVLVYTNMGISPIWAVMLVNVVMMTGVSSRMISSSALMTAVPDAKDRGAFMAINSSIQQASGGIAAMVAGLIVIKQPSGHLDRFDVLGYVIAGSMIVMIPLMYVVHKYVQRKMGKTAGESKIMKKMKFHYK
uniref:MFS transporter n=1 Tax=uncultured Chitinophaga sp. TaxID=339340 RepID=UPI0025E96CB3